MKCSKVCVCVHFCFCVTKSSRKKCCHNRKINKYVIYGERGGKLLEYVILFLVFAFLTKEDSKREKEMRYEVKEGHGKNPRTVTKQS